MLLALKVLTIFSIVGALDFVWARYTTAVTEQRIWKACGYSAAIYLLGGLSTLGYVTNPWMLAPAMLGAVAGTALAMRMEKKTNP